jgi:hypothetical protein
LADSLFVDDRHIYLVGNAIWQIDRDTNAARTLDIPTNRSFAFDGGGILYINERSEIVRYDLKTEENIVIPDVVTTCFYLTDKELFFVNRLDRRRLYSLNLAANEMRKVIDREILYFYCDNEYIYFQDSRNYTLYRSDKDGGDIVFPR